MSHIVAITARAHVGASGRAHLDTMVNHGEPYIHERIPLARSPARSAALPMPIASAPSCARGHHPRRQARRHDDLACESKHGRTNRRRSENAQRLAETGRAVIARLLTWLRRTPRITIDESRLRHIFRVADGHFPIDTAANRRALLHVAGNPANRLGVDRFGVAWAAQSTEWRPGLGSDLGRPNSSTVDLTPDREFSTFQ